MDSKCARAPLGDSLATHLGGGLGFIPFRVLSAPSRRVWIFAESRRRTRSRARRPLDVRLVIKKMSYVRTGDSLHAHWQLRQRAISNFRTTPGGARSDSRSGPRDRATFEPGRSASIPIDRGACSGALTPSDPVPPSPPPGGSPVRLRARGGGCSGARFGARGS